MLVQEWLELCYEYWKDGEASTFVYLWAHFLFEEMRDAYPNLEKIWKTVETLSAFPPHFFAQQGAYEDNFSKTPNIKSISALIGNIAPVLKLNHKYLLKGEISHHNTNLGMILWLYNIKSADKDITDKLSLLHSINKNSENLFSLKAIIK